MSYALVICNHGPYGAGDSGVIAGLKYQDFTFEVSRPCRGKAGLLIPAKTAGEIAGRFDLGLPVYSTVFYPNLGRVLKYREIRDFEIKVPFKKKALTVLEVNFCCYLSLYSESINFCSSSQVKDGWLNFECSQVERTFQHN